MQYSISMLTPFKTDSFSSNLLEQITPLLTRLESDYYNTKLKVTINQSIVAVAVSWSNPIHPQARYFKIYIDDSLLENRLLKEQLLAQLEKNGLPSSDRFIYSLMNKQVDTISLLESNGYNLIRKTFEPTLTVEDCLTHMTLSPHPTVLSYRELFKNSTLKAEFLFLLKRNYASTHLVNPVAEMTLSEWETLLFDDQPDMDLSIVGLTDGHVSSYITSFSADDTSVEIAWMGLKEEDATAYLELQQLFRKQLETFKKKGILSIETEIDTTDHYALGMFSFIDFTELESFNAYRKLIL